MCLEYLADTEIGKQNFYTCRNLTEHKVVEVWVYSNNSECLIYPEQFMKEKTKHIKVDKLSTLVSVRVT